MKMLKRTYWLSMLILISCGKNQKTNELKEIVASNTITSDEHSWPQTVDQFDSQNQVRVIKYQMTKHQLENERNSYRETDLQPYPVAPKYNTQVFKMLNIDEYKSFLFIPPKVWVYGHVDGGRTSPVENSDGSITIPFPFVMVTGLEEKVLDPSGLREVSLPNNLKVKEIPNLYGETGMQLAALPGCPKKVIINFNGNDYDATPNEFLRGDYCDLSRPINAFLKLSKKEARYFLEEAIYNHAAHISVVYETKARFNKGRVQLEFNRSLIWEELQARLKAKILWAEADIRMHLREIFSKQTMRVSVVGDVNANMNKLIDYAINQFMTPFTPVNPIEMSECGGGKISACFKLSYSKFKESNSFKIEWFESDTAMTGQNYVTFATLQPLTDRTVAIGDNDESGPLQKGFKRETGLTIVPGDLVEISPTKIVKTIRQNPIPVEVEKNSIVCVDRAPVSKVCAEYAPKEFHGDGCMGKGCLNPKMRSTQNHCIRWNEIGGECRRTENQWIKMISYGLGSISQLTIDKPVAKMEVLFNGMEFGFEWLDQASKEKKFLTCPLEAFSYKADGQKASIRIEETSTCPIFEKAGKSSIMLYLINNMGQSEEYLDGNLITNYKNETLETPKKKTYEPEVGFFGTIGIRGYGIWGETTQRSFAQE
jgi:hypothetical protein